MIKTYIIVVWQLPFFSEVCLIVFFFFFFFLGGVAMVLQHRYFIQKILGTSTICSHGYGFDMP